MNDNIPAEPDMELHDRQVRAVTEAVAKLLPKLAGQGFTPEAIFEGATKGAAVALIAAHSDLTGPKLAELFDNIAAGFRDLGKPDLHVVN